MFSYYFIEVEGVALLCMLILELMFVLLSY